MSSSQVDETNHGQIVEAILRERYPPLYLSSYQSNRQRLLSTSPPMCVRRFDTTQDKDMTPQQGRVTSHYVLNQNSSLLSNTLPRLPGIGQLIMNDKIFPENQTNFEPYRLPMSRAEIHREKLITEPDDVDTDGSIPDLTEVIPPPRRKRAKPPNVEKVSILHSANAIQTSDQAVSTKVLDSERVTKIRKITKIIRIGNLQRFARHTIFISLGKEFV